MRTSIVRVEPHAPQPPILRGHFLVHYQVDGKAGRRIIILPGTWADGEAEFEKAKLIFEEEGLLKPDTQPVAPADQASPGR